MGNCRGGGREKGEGGRGKGEREEGEEGEEGERERDVTINISWMRRRGAYIWVESSS